MATDSDGFSIEGEALRDVAAERGVLAGPFRHGVDAFIDADDLVTDRSFTVDSNRVIYKCLRHLFGQDPDCRPDVPSLMSAAAAVGHPEYFSDANEVRHLRAVVNMPVELASVRRLAGKVRKLEIARAGLEVAERIKDGLLGVTGDEPIGAILSLLEEPAFGFSNSLAGSGDDEPRRLGDGLELWLEGLALNPVEMVGLPSGYPRLDRAVGGGLRKQSITLFGARSGMGKSFVGMNIGVRVAAGAGYEWPRFDVRPRVPVLFLDTEMDEEDHRLRILANLSGVPMDAIETGRFHQDALRGPKAREAAAMLRDIPYDVKSIAGQPFEETLSVMRRWVQRKVGIGPDGKAKDCLIVFDYMKLMDAAGLSKQLQEFQALGFMMTGLHNFMVRYSIPAVAFCQLNRDGINSEETNAVGGSDRLLHLASNLIYHKPQSDDELADQLGRGPKYDFKWVVLKKRRGKGLAKGDYINIRSDYATGRLEEGPLQSELKKTPPSAGFEAAAAEGGEDAVSFA